MRRITATRGDDLGMQIYARLYAMAYCQLLGERYIHTPLKESLQGYESFFNLGLGEEISSKEERMIDIGSYAKPSTISKHHPVFPALHFCNQFRSRILKKYNSTPKKNSLKFLRSSGIKIAIHARKTNSDGRKKELRDTPNYFLQGLVNKLDRVFAGERISIHVYSNRKISFNISESVAQNKELKMYTHYQTDVKEAIHDMIKADYLFKYGVSTFSGVCAFYREKPTFFEFPIGMHYLMNAFSCDSGFYYNNPIKTIQTKSFCDFFKKAEAVPCFPKNWIETLK